MTTTNRPGASIGPRDVMIASVLAVVQVAATYLAAHHHSGARHLNALGLSLLLAGPVLLVARRRWPVAVLAGVFVTTGLYLELGFAGNFVWFGLIGAFFGALLSGHRRAAYGSLLAGYALAVVVPHFAQGTNTRPSLGFDIALLAWLLVLLSVAEVVRYRREGNRAKARSREEEARRQASEQRLAIAREVHDVVAHHMSLINVQASAALHLMDADPERARVALTAIKGASKDALVDLRSLLGVLRRVDEDLPREPARGMRDLDELVARASAAGLEVRVVVGGERRDLPSAVDLAAYRIVQEALTNVARHAIGATTVTIGLGYGAEDLVIEVSDDGRGAPVTVVGAASARDGHESHTAGSGISGMRERCATLGGTLEAGPGPEGGFRVRAWLPVTAPGGDR